MKQGPIKPPVEPFPPVDDSEWEVAVPQVGSISQLTEKEEGAKVKKNPIGFYEHQTKKKTKRRRG